MSLESQRDIPEMKRVFDAWSARLKEWNPQQAQSDYEHKLARYKIGAERAKAAGAKMPREPKAPVVSDLDPNHPATLFNGKIAPLVPFALRGVLWYQGESSATLPEAFAYKQQLIGLVTDWRRRWAQPDLPFAWVQLPNFKRDAEAWPRVREAMLEALVLPHTGMAVAIDVGDPADIHPTNKRPVGQRLARWALADVYGRGGPSSSPLPASHAIEGPRVIVRFAHADGGLIARGGAPTGFMLAGEDRQWHPASATIDGDRVIVTSDPVPKPVAVRYAWSDDPGCNLYNGAGFPASPFRTDRWAPPETTPSPGSR
jgi:sialate O-acetylesterase